MVVKILLVEDQPRYHQRWQREIAELTERVEVLSALSISEAEEYFATHVRELAAIAIDACVPGDQPNTICLVKKFRKKFKGPIIAISGQSEFKQLLLQAGCSHESLKCFLSQKIAEVIFTTDALKEKLLVRQDEEWLKKK